MNKITWEGNDRNGTIDIQYEFNVGDTIYYIGILMVEEFDFCKECCGDGVLELKNSDRMVTCDICDGKGKQRRVESRIGIISTTVETCTFKIIQDYEGFAVRISYDLADSESSNYVLDDIWNLDESNIFENEDDAKLNLFKLENEGKINEYLMDNYGYTLDE